MTISKRQLAAAVRSATHLAERERLAAFIDADTSAFAPNPFAVTSAGAVLQRWSRQGFEFGMLGVAHVGLDCLLRSLRPLPLSQPLRLEILKSGPYTLCLYHLGDGCHVVGGVLHGEPGAALPAFSRPAAWRRPRANRAGQLDLFGTTAWQDALSVP